MPKRLPHRGAAPNPRRAKQRRRRRRHTPAAPPPPPTDLFLLPFNDLWRPLYNDHSRVRCGGYATAIMCAIYHARFIDPNPIYDRALVLQPPGPATSPWANLTAAQEQGLLSGHRWFNDLPTARATLSSNLAFIVLANAHIFCIRGFSDSASEFYVTDDAGAPSDWALPYSTFEEWMTPAYAVCGVGVFS